MRRLVIIFFVMICACSVAALAQTAQVQASAEKPFVHPLFSDDMVLQRRVRFPVWGWTTPGARVTVSLLGESSPAVADAEGKWIARLGPFEAGGPYTLTTNGPQS